MASPALVSIRETHGPVVGVLKGEGSSPPTWRVRLSQIAQGYFRRRWNRLDIEETPNSVKRDLGFLDGHAPYREEDRLR
ncbi:MAG: hypothetical protein E6Q76_12515 [Rhizobium sp.]|nr:MAG: hypothetical protein E6Q76_12515 [Rhizobium sp.]